MELNTSCIICGHLRRELPRMESVIARATFPAFANRAAHGCIICALICNTAVTWFSSCGSVAQDKVLIKVIEVYARNENLKELEVRGYELLRPCLLDQNAWERNLRSLFSAVWYSPLESPSPIPRIPTLPHITRPLSGPARDMLRGWLESCDAHQNCRSSDVKMLPKRLVDVGNMDEATIKITSAIEGHRYLALSHCWGFGKKFFRITKANEASMRLGIPCEALPQSFQDAIKVTRWLNMRYIWIDSLCILQDDEQDWEEESANMAGIFSGCYLAIAASRASSCDEGFLQVRKEIQQVISGTHQGVPLDVFARDSIGHTSSLGAVPRPFHDLPLFKRGWCFQERLLAPRTLHFACDELFFQCRTEDRCECSGRDAWKPAKQYCYAYYAATVSWESRQIRAYQGQNRTSLDTEYGSDGEVNSSFSRDFSTTKSFSESNAAALVRRLYEVSGSITEDQELPINFGQLWGDIVSDYVSLNLTFQQDMLPALSGLADLMLTNSPGRYFAGIWELDIHYFLGWSSVPTDVKCYRPQEATAPSFSWASRFGPVGFPWNCLITRVCTVLDIRCEAKGANPYGQVLQGGYIILQGKLIPGTVNSCRKNTVWSYSVDVCGTRGEECSAVLDFDTEEDEKDLGRGTESRVYCFDLFRKTGWEDHAGNGADLPRVHSIVLREANEPGTFRRVGTALAVPTPAFDIAADVTVKII